MPVGALVRRHVLHFWRFAAVAGLGCCHLHAVVNYRAVRTGGHDAIEINRDAASEKQNKTKTSFFFSFKSAFAFTPLPLHPASINTENPQGLVVFIFY